MKKLKWTQDEDDLLIRLIGKQSETVDWDCIQLTMNSLGSIKSLKQIRRRLNK